MTMPVGGYPPRIYELTPGDLAILSVNGLGNGQSAFVLQNRFVYILQPAVGVADGSNILDTLDDVSRQWVFINYGEPTSFPGYGPAPPSVGAASAAGAAATVSRSDHTHLGVETIAAADVNGGIGVSTPDGANWKVQSIPISVATPAALAAIPALGLATGQPANVAAMRTGSGPGKYYLGAAISTAPDNFFIIAASGDASRQWIYSIIAEQGYLGITSAEIDYTAIQNIVMLPPMNYKCLFIQSPQGGVTQKDGTITTGPTMNGGTDATFTNMFASAIQTGLAAESANAKKDTLLGTNTQGFNMDLSAHGMVFQITAGAVKGTATVFKGRVFTTVIFYQ